MPRGLRPAGSIPTRVLTSVTKTLYAAEAITRRANGKVENSFMVRDEGQMVR